MRTVEEIAALMAGSRFSPEEQVRQTTLRWELVRFWGIEPGARVLEIGCGQGDTTAVLAEVVGPTGEVVAFDPAPGSYGAPVTLGESLAHLKSQFPDVQLKYIVDCPLKEIEGAFDWVVLSHCSWYFKDQQDLAETLKRATEYAPQLGFSEWDMRITSLDQLAHLLAVLIQSAEPLPEGNIRSPLMRKDIAKLLKESGWQIRSETIVDSSFMTDGSWEASMCHEASLSSPDPRLQAHHALLENILLQDPIKSLPSWAVVCGT